MSKRSKRSEDTPSSAKRFVVRAGANEGLPTLPIDLWASIFAFAPVRARLWAISLVCKRWRIAALRSITAFSFPLLWGLGGDRGKAPSINAVTLPAALQLFPYVTCLDVKVNCHCLMLPTTLQHLQLCGSYLAWLTKASAPCVLTARFPRLTSLSLTVPCTKSSSEAERTSITNFIAAHADQLTSLKTCTVDYSLDEWDVCSHIAFPSLLDLTCEAISASTLTSLIHNCPMLRSLDITAKSFIFDMDPALLTALVDLAHWQPLPPLLSITVVETFISKLPRLRNMSSSQCTIPKLARLVTIGDGQVDKLCSSQFPSPNIEVLFVQLYRTTTVPAVSLYLPRLTTLYVTTQTLPLCCAIAREFLKRAPMLAKVELCTKRAGGDEGELTSLLRDIALRGGIRVVLDVGRDIPIEIRSFASCGWLDVCCEKETER